MEHRMTISGIFLAILTLLLAPVTAQAQDCSNCQGGVTELTLFYIGTTAYIEVYQGEEQKAVKLLYEGWHEWGDTFTFQGINADGTVGGDISLWEDDVLITMIHTSCSEPIGPGLIAGDFEVVEGYSRDGGLLCPLPCSDLDEDGYGTPANPACDYPERDCNDSDPGINPGAAEVCDGIDNNCIDGIDEDPIASDSCDNGLYCDGEEYCDAGSCHAGTPVDCGDGVGCTLDSCNEATDSCDHIPDDALCDDAQWCNGAETCNATLGCQEGPDPCPDDGLWCNGIEGCDEGSDQCTNSGDPCPDDGLFCNGTEVCNEGSDQCTNTGDPCPDDGLWCNGIEGCDEGSDQCTNSGDPCPDDGLFCNGTEVCNEGSDQCTNSGDPCPDDGLWCNGAEGCDEGSDQCTNTGDPCEDGNNCTDSICIEQTHACESTCNATGPEDACCDDPTCWQQAVCHDYDGDGMYADFDCDDDDSDDPPVCGTCVCGDAECAPCARCINNYGSEFPGDGVDSNCNNQDDCFIATASLGSSMEGKVDVLRSFRDNYLMDHPSGRAFVDAYYKYSPRIAVYIAERSWLRTVVRTLLLPVVGFVSMFP